MLPRALPRSRDVSAPVIPKKTSSGSRNWRGATTPATRPATTTNLPARCVCLFHRIVGSSVRACCANEAMPAQEESEDAEQYDSDKSDDSVATSVGGASSDSEPPLTRRPAKNTVAKKSTATKAGQVSSLRPARSVEPLQRATCGGACNLHFGESSVQTRILQATSQPLGAAVETLNEAGSQKPTVRLFAHGRFVDPLLRATCGGACTPHFGESSVQGQCRQRRARVACCRSPKKRPPPCAATTRIPKKHTASRTDAMGAAGVRTKSTGLPPVIRVAVCPRSVRLAHMGHASTASRCALAASSAAV